MKLQWDPSFSVGHEAMDLQHRSIFMLIEELREQDGPSLDAAQRQAILSSLTEYTLKHFAQEEALLGGLGYPGLADQAASHRHFARAVADRCLGAMGSQPSGPGDLLPFLESWWRHHILEEDMAYRAFLLARGAGRD